MKFVCIVFELGDKMLTLSSMENLIVQCNQESASRLERCRLKMLTDDGRTDGRRTDAGCLYIL